MSELDLCSRREADKIISTSTNDIENGPAILVRGRPISPILGQKVDSDEMEITIIRKGGGIVIGSDHNGIHHNDSSSVGRELVRAGDTIVLNKPPGYVSGQPEKGHGHIPAVRLLTRDNLVVSNGSNNSNTSNNGDELLSIFPNKTHSFRRWTGKDDESIDQQQQQQQQQQQRRPTPPPKTLFGYAPAGRLDLDSSGLVIFTRCGVMAKKLIGQQPKPQLPSKSGGGGGGISKEYIVTVQPVQGITRIEKEMGIQSLPYPPRKNLKPLLKGGLRLWNDHRPLLPLPVAEWIINDNDDYGLKEEDSESVNNDDGYNNDDNGNNTWTGKLRLVLRGEGRKRQIRRMCRELLGFHVTKLVRTKIGGIQLNENLLPEGKWRPLNAKEVRDIYSS